MIGEGGFGSVFRGRVKVLDHESGFESLVDVAVKQLNRNGFQARILLINCARKS